MSASIRSLSARARPTAAVVTFIVLVPTVLIFFLAERAMRNDGALAAGMGKL